MQLTLDRKSLLAAFCVSLGLTLASPALHLPLAPAFFVPFLVIAVYKKSLATCLWLAFGCGWLLDLLASSTRLGVYSLAFCTAMASIYPLKRYFFADSLSTLPVMAFLFSSLATVVTAILIYFVDAYSLFSMSWFLTNVLFMPLIDGTYAFCLFILPALVLGKRIRSGSDYFLSNS